MSSVGGEGNEPDPGNDSVPVDEFNPGIDSVPVEEFDPGNEPSSKEEEFVLLKDFNAASPTFDLTIGGNKLCLVRKRFQCEISKKRPQLGFYEFAHIKNNVNYIFTRVY